MSKIGLVSDSSCGLPADLVKQYGISIIPIDVIIDDSAKSTYTTADLVGALSVGKHVTTSRPSPEIFAHMYRSLVDQNCDSIVVATLSSKLSGTYESAVLAADAVDVTVQVVDTQTVGLGFGFAVLDAARALENLSTDEVAELLRKQSESARVFFYLDTLEYLRKGGRVGAASAVIGSALSVKPILQISGGMVEPFAKVRTESKALERLIEAALESQVNSTHPRFGVEHLGAPEKASYCIDALRAAHPNAEIICSEVSAVIGAHAGPGLVGVIASDSPAI